MLHAGAWLAVRLTFICAAHRRPWVWLSMCRALSTCFNALPLYRPLYRPPVPPADELETDDHYHLPTAYDDSEKGRSQKYEVLTQRYR